MQCPKGVTCPTSHQFQVVQYLLLYPVLTSVQVLTLHYTHIQNVSL